MLASPKKMPERIAADQSSGSSVHGTGNASSSGDISEKIVPHFPSMPLSQLDSDTGCASGQPIVLASIGDLSANNADSDPGAIDTFYESLVHSCLLRNLTEIHKFHATRPTNCCLRNVSPNVLPLWGCDIKKCRFSSSRCRRCVVAR